MSKTAARFMIASLMYVFICSGCGVDSEPAIRVEPIRPGIVNVNESLKFHKDWDTLSNLDRKLLDIEKRISEAQGASFNELGEEHAKKMSEAHKKAQAELEAELKKVESALDAQKRQIQLNFEQDLKKAQSEVQKMRQSSAPASKSAAVLTNDMIILRDRQVSAKRLALQKQTKEKIDRERNRLDDELAAYESQISKENQAQRLNIQLKLQLNVGEEDKKALQDELAAINEEEYRLKDAKRVEIASKIDEMAKKEFAAVEEEVEAYKKQLDSDIKKQVGYNPSGSGSASEVEAKAKSIEAALLEKQKNLELQMTEAGNRANRQLNEKREQIEKRLKELDNSLTEEMAQSKDSLIRADMERIAQLQSEYQSVQTERDNLYRTMLDDLEEIILDISKKENVNAVFLSFIVNVSSVDLTDKVVEALKKEEN